MSGYEAFEQKCVLDGYETRDGVTYDLHYTVTITPGSPTRDATAEMGDIGLLPVGADPQGADDHWVAYEPQDWAERQALYDNAMIEAGMREVICG